MLSRVIVVAAVAFASAAHDQSHHLALVQQQAMLHSTDGLKAKSRSPGATVGATVPTTEEGYKTVAALKNDEEMRSFIHRVVQKEARYVKDAAGLSGILPYYSGTQAVQSLEALKKELRASTWIADGEGRTAPLNDVGYQKVAALKSRPHMMAFARRVLDSERKKCSDEGSLIGVMPYYDGEITVQTFDNLRNELSSASWAHLRDDDSVPVTSPVVLQEQAASNEHGVGNRATSHRDSKDDFMLGGFDRIDTNDDGFVNEAELARYMASLDQTFGNEQVAQMLEEADLDGDGQINSEEFLKVME